MNNQRPVIFFRNDDVRNSLDNSLIEMTELFILNKVPISHAVEPANVSQEVVNWLIMKKKEHPDLVEIIQHGFNHNIDNPGLKMEFGGKRGFEDQLFDIRQGVELMNTYFTNLWTPVFTFPYGTFNRYSLEALAACHYKVLSSKIKFSGKARIKNLLGRTFGIDEFRGKKINYHPGLRKNYGFREISVSVNLIRKYTGSKTAIHYDYENIINQITLAARHTNIIGILLHHRFHENEMQLISGLIQYLRQNNFAFSTFSQLIQEK
jgi:hypothetical protein